MKVLVLALFFFLQMSCFKVFMIYLNKLLFKPNFEFILIPESATLNIIEPRMARYGGVTLPKKFHKRCVEFCVEQE